MIQLSSPLLRPWASSALELAHLALSALLVWGALRDRRSGDGRAGGVLGAALVYGAMLDLVALAGVGGYVHGRFTVMILDRLPLYIALMYINHLGLTWRLLEGVQAPRWSRAAAAGLCGVLLDGSLQRPALALGWWTWRDDNPLFAVRWAGIPVADLMWGALFPAAFMTLAMGAEGAMRARRGGGALVVALGVALFTPLLGAALFLPYHGLVAAGLGEGGAGAVMLAAVAVAAWPALRGAGLLDPLRGAFLAYVGLLAVANLWAWRGPLTLIGEGLILALALVMGRRRPAGALQPSWDQVRISSV